MTLVAMQSHYCKLQDQREM